MATRKVVVDIEETESVTVTVPKAYRLNTDDGKTLHIEAGVQEMPLVHAKHWFSVAHGVTIYEPEAPVGADAGKKPKAPTK